MRRTAPLAGLWLMALLAAAAFAAQNAPPSRVVFCIALAFVPYALLLFEAPLSVRTTTALVALAGVPAALALPVLSDDVYRYLWDGHVLLSGVDPYAHAPASPPLAGLRDADWARINHPVLATIYPPLAQGLFALGRLLGGVWAFKVLALLGHLAVVGLLARAFSDRAAAAFGLNPLALSESALSGHVDVFAGLGLLVAGWMLVQRRAHLAALGALWAVGIKLVGLLALPFVLLQQKRAVWAVPLALLFLVPLMNAGYADADGAPGAVHYAGRWTGNAGPFWAIETASVALTRQVVRDPDRIVFENVPESFWAVFDREKKPRSPHAVNAPIVGGLLARAIAAGLVLVVLFLRLRAPPLVALRDTTFAALLLAPQLHPWYLLWLLPLEAALARRAAFVWSAVVLVAYVPLDGWRSARIWQESGLAVALQFILVVAALLLEARRRAVCAAEQTPLDRPLPSSP